MKKPLPIVGLEPSALRAYTMVFALVALWFLFDYYTGGTFLTPRNLSNLTRQTAVTGILAVGMLMVIVAGQIDLSVGSVVGLTGGAAAMMQAWQGQGLLVSVATGIVVGLTIGVLQGALVAYANIPAFIVTLGGLLAWRGAIKGLSQGITVPLGLQSFKDIGQQYLEPAAGWVLAGAAVVAIVWMELRKRATRQRLGLEPPGLFQTAGRILLPSGFMVAFVAVMNLYAGVPIPVLLLAAIALAGGVVTRNTTFGRYLYAIGGNAEAARLSGIDLKKRTLAVFGLMGVLAGIAGVVYTARVGSASPDAGVLLELDAIAACVIGGASLVGGRGTVSGACLGALFMASLDNGMSLQNVEDFKMDMIKGAILVSAVGLDVMTRKS